MAHITLSEQIIPQHCAKRRRKSHRQPEGEAVLHQPLHHREQRNVGFRDRFEEPIFLKKVFVFRMADEGKMRVEKKREMAGGTCHSERSEESLNRSQRLEQREILRIRSG